MTGDKYTLPRDICEWCGGEFVWVRLVMGGGSESIKLDPQPLENTHPDAKYARMPEQEAAGRVDCVKPCGTTNQRCYSAHKATCPQRNKWAGPKKVMVTRKNLDTLLTPELDRFPDPSGLVMNLP
jgi:hypothetical protein